MVLKQLDIHMQENGKRSPSTFRKINSKMIYDLNRKLIEDNIEENLDDLSYDNDFYTTSKVQFMKEIFYNLPGLY